MRMTGFLEMVDRWADCFLWALYHGGRQIVNRIQGLFGPTIQIDSEGGCRINSIKIAIRTKKTARRDRARGPLEGEVPRKCGPVDPVKSEVSQGRRTGSGRGRRVRRSSMLRGCPLGDE